MAFSGCRRAIKSVPQIRKKLIKAISGKSAVNKPASISPGGPVIAPKMPVIIVKR